MKFQLIFFLFILQKFQIYLCKQSLTFQLPNHLKVLIISDKSLTLNGMALHVEIGSSHEPRKLSGIAHLLEHMLHMKSHKYPIEGFFKHNLALFQGSSNAMTNDISTTYYFWINDQRFDSFQKIASIFSRFFIDPIIDKDGVEREINAVHNEYEDKIVSDNRRFLELLRNLANKRSLLYHFNTGNKQKLNTSAYDIHKELNEFFNKYYSSHKMQLVIYGNHPLEQFKTLSNLFYEIPYKYQWKNPIHIKFLDNTIREKYPKNICLFQRNLGEICLL